MTELTRSLIAAAREGLAPDAAVAARVRAKVAAAVGASAAATGSVAAVSAAGSASTLTKLGAVLVAIGAFTTGAVVATSDRSPEVPRLAVTPSAADEVRDDIRVVAPSERFSEGALARMVESSSPHAEASPPHAEASPPPRESAPHVIAHTEPHADHVSAEAARPARVAEPTDEPEGASLAREVELIDLAMVSLRKRAPHAALEAIKAYHRVTHGRGQMAEDAAAIEIEARCNMDLDATALIARFDLKWPESAQRERIQTACFAKR
jgi:hypothetical protein